jgi:hypothetical protein
MLKALFLCTNEIDNILLTPFYNKPHVFFENNIGFEIFLFNSIPFFQ